jgi:hypothetical protein
MATVAGMVSAAQSKKVNRRPDSSRIRPIAIRLGGDPTGIPIATEDPHVSISSRPTG